MTIAGAVVSGLAIGILVGLSIGLIVQKVAIQKAYKNMQCKNCKHFIECQGDWKKCDANNNCKLFKPNLKEAGVVVSQDLFSKLNEIDKLLKHVGDIEKQMLEASEEVEFLKNQMEVMQSEFRSKEH